MIKELPLVIDNKYRPKWYEKPFNFLFEGLQDNIIGSNGSIDFDLAGSLRYVLVEKAFAHKKPFYLYLPFNVTVPKATRKYIKRILAGPFAGKNWTRFPQWPVEKSLMALHHVMCKTGLLRSISWPQGKKYAVCLTHDIDSSVSFNNIDYVHELEKNFRLPATWFMLTHVYKLEKAVLGNLLSSGDELACHGDNHDNRLAFVNPGLMQKRVASMVDAFSAVIIEKVGFRAPSLYMTRALRETIARYFLYDSSCVDTGKNSPERHGGCGYLLPYTFGGLTHVPITLPLDSSLLYSGINEAEFFDIWKSKIEFVRETGGAAVVCTHPEPHLMMRQNTLSQYKRLLEYIKNDDSAYICTLKGLLEIYKTQKQVNCLDVTRRIDE